VRIKVELRKEEGTALPKDHRNYFLSFLKRVFSEGGSFDNLYLRKKTKPFVFSFWLGKDFEVDEEIKISDEISMLFSTGDFSILTSFYNGIINMKKQNVNISLGELKLKIERVSILPPKRVTAKKILCKTVGISVFTNPEASSKDFKKWYIIPTDNIDLFNYVLKKRTNERYRYINGNTKDFEINLKPLSEEEFHIFKSLSQQKKLKSSINETIVKHYGGYLRGFRGVFFLEGDQEILQFIYDYGMGVRTGQGFGMIDIIG
jgi:CRISPR-associated endoribonuclease Cas6